MALCRSQKSGGLVRVRASKVAGPTPLRGQRLEALDLLDPPMNSLPLPRLNRAAFVRRILVAGVMLAGFGPALRAAEGTASPPVLRAAAVTFSVQPRVGMPSGGSRTANLIEEVVGDLKTTLVYLDYGSTRLCFLTSPFGVHYRALNQPIRQALADVLKLSLAEVVAASSHNHTVPAIELGAGPPMIGDRIGTGMNEFGREYLEALRAQTSEVSEKKGNDVLRFEVNLLLALYIHGILCSWIFNLF